MADWIQPVDIYSTDLDTYASIMNAGMREDWGELAQQHAVEDLRVAAASSNGAVRYYLFRVQDRAIGTLDVFMDPDEPDIAYCYVRVAAAYAGYRTGQALIAYAENLARREGRRVMRGTSAASALRDDRNTRFIKKCGYREIRSLLRQDITFPGQRDWGQPETGIDGLDLAIINTVPGLSVCEELATLKRAHAIEEYGPTSTRVQYDARGIRYRIQAIQESGRYLQYALLFDHSTGKAVGMSTLEFRPGSPLAEQYETYFLPEYRTRRAQEFIKRQGMQVFVENNPDAPAMRTFNSVAHPEILELNRELGFTDTFFYRDWEKDLS